MRKSPSALFDIIVIDIPRQLPILSSNKPAEVIKVIDAIIERHTRNQESTVINYN